ncbi:MAG: hypothetical protein M1819_005523 [Sarea resinae]|nr:MAG: hypothetical protein M1819_005523 [Sarea resinae]
MATSSEKETKYYILVTGANSGLGFAICCRLIDEFLSTHLPSHSLTLIITTRDSRKANDTVARLQEHLQKATDAAAESAGTEEKPPNSRITFQPESLDLTSLRSVLDLSNKLLATLPKLDAVILNAGYGGFTGINWPLAVWSIMTDWVRAVTWPTFKLSGIGYVTKSQLGLEGVKNISNESPKSIAAVTNGTINSDDEPPLGEVFCSNVFGHYVLSHHLTPLLSESSNSGQKCGRIIWLSSLEAYADCFSVADIQGLKSPKAYEASKRLTDVLALTSSLPSTSAWTDRFFTRQADKVKMYVVHPGICATGILPLPAILWFCMAAAFYVARWLGSPWHTVRAYSGAWAPVWIALSSQPALDELEDATGPTKWGSSTDRLGRDRVMQTEVEGWGYGGSVGDTDGNSQGRRPGVKNLTAEERESFEELGRECWQEMEGLREEWELRLAAS